MATSLLTVNTTAATSSDLVVAAGTPVTVALKTTSPALLDSGASVLIKLKDDAGVYNTVGELNAYNTATVITGPGTYQFARPAGPSCGVFSA